MKSYVLSLAAKNILRNKRRTVLTFSMLVFGVSFYILLSALFEGFDRAAFESIINFESGHIKARSDKYDKDFPFDPENFMENSSAVMESIRKDPSVLGVAPRILFSAEMDNGLDDTPVLVTGIDPQADDSVFGLGEYFTDGSFDPTGAVVGADLAKEMSLYPGDPFYITFRTKAGAYYSLELWVAALLKSPDPAGNKTRIFIDIALASNVLGTPGAATEIAVKTDNLKTAAKTAERLRKRTSGVSIQSWDEMSHGFTQTMQTKGKMSQIILFFILIIAMIGIVNTVLISVFEKRKEIGTLKAIGFSDSEVRNIFVLEGAIVGFIGSLLGALLGALFNAYLSTVGLDYGAIMEGLGDDMGIGFLSIVRTTWNPEHYIVPVTLSTLASALAAYLPARRAMKMDPAGALRTT